MGKVLYADLWGLRKGKYRCLLGQEGQAPIPRAAFCVKQESGFVFGDAFA